MASLSSKWFSLGGSAVALARIMILIFSFRSVYGGSSRGAAGLEGWRRRTTEKRENVRGGMQGTSVCIDYEFFYFSGKNLTYYSV